MNLFKLAQTALIAVLLTLSGMAPTIAQDASTRVVVPDAPGGADFGGCYRVLGPLYGPYTMTFCLKNKGSYTVTGGGIKCNGRLSWRSDGRNIDIQLRRTSCGKGVAWSADVLRCRPGGIFSGIVPFVVIPDVPILSNLRCTYEPDARGYKDTRITARRIS